MKVYYDLHIHSGLSPCANNDMTPNNIVNMAILKGLNMIAVTDHNRALNVQPTMNVAKKTDLIVVPGIEVETVEGIHLVCYFETIESLLNFEKIIYQGLPIIENNVALLGEQYRFNSSDDIIGTENKMLLNSCHYNLNEMVECCHSLNGIVSLAHIDRHKFSIITTMGFIPLDLSYEMIELSNKTDEATYYKKGHKPIKPIICNSDAHQLGDISEQVHYFELKEKSINGLFSILRGESDA